VSGVTPGIGSSEPGADYLDEPDPALAVLGPPAVTRRMVELWRTDQTLRSRFDLSNPLHRRDFLSWTSENAGVLGLYRSSVAVVFELLGRGLSLSRPDAPWRAQASQIRPPSSATVEAWLAEPILLEFGAQGAGIPMPRALALVWELRQDIRLHFANRTRTEILQYLTWCLTQGVRDGCVAVDLVEPALAPFLDALDLEFSPQKVADRPPVTRLLRMMAPLYNGPHPEIAKEFPHTRSAWVCVAIWVCGLMRRRNGWPLSFVRRPLQWLTQPVPEAGDAFVALTNLALGLWELRSDLQARCNLVTHEGRAALAQWLHDRGAAEYGLEDRVSGQLPATAPGILRQAAPARTRPRVSRDVCLIGYAGLVSGRAEDLRMTGLALSEHRRQWAMLDRLTGAITAEDGRPATGLVGPPQVDLLHLNADTAFFDYLFLREHGIERAYTIGYWAWELAKFPGEWRSSFEFVDEVWVASRFAYEAIAPAATKPVFLMPPAVSVGQPEPGMTRADFGLPERKLLFYFSFDWRSYSSRKNPLAAVAAFRRAFPRNADPVCLVLKTIGSGWKASEHDALAEEVRDDRGIVIIDREFERARSTALLELCDCFVSLHRSEGFGRGPAEAMLLGKPVIATDYSGTSDFVMKETALPVRYELVPVGMGEYPGAEGQVWAQADIDEAAAAMRRIVGDPGLADRLGRAARLCIPNLYDPKVVGARYVERLGAIAKAA